MKYTTNYFETILFLCKFCFKHKGSVGLRHAPYFSTYMRIDEICRKIKQKCLQNKRLYFHMIEKKQQHRDIVINTIF